MSPTSSASRIIVTLALALAAAACARDSSSKKGTEKVAEPDRLSDSQILGVLVTATQGEVDFSRPAITQATDPSVRAFAEMMVRHHEDGLDKAHQAASVTHLSADHSPVTDELEATMKSERGKLKLDRSPSKDQDIAFMCAELRLHQGLLDAIDDKLSPAAQDLRVKAELTATRPVVVAHLEQARSIVQNLSGTSTTSACR
jgi:putative membrane protein